jgi:hypothetical protein
MRGPGFNPQNHKTNKQIATKTNFEFFSLALYRKYPTLQGAESAYPLPKKSLVSGTKRTFTEVTKPEFQPIFTLNCPQPG